MLELDWPTADRMRTSQTAKTLGPLKSSASTAHPCSIWSPASPSIEPLLCAVLSGCGVSRAWSEDEHHHCTQTDLSSPRPLHLPARCGSTRSFSSHPTAASTGSCRGASGRSPSTSPHANARGGSPGVRLAKRSLSPWPGSLPPVEEPIAMPARLPPR